MRTLQSRQGLQTGSPDEIAFAKDWIDAKALSDRATRFAKNDYGAYLEPLLS